MFFDTTEKTEGGKRLAGVRELVSQKKTEKI